MDSSLKDKILAQIKPTDLEHEEFVKVAKRLINKIKRTAKKLDIICSPYIGGSFGKGTYLKGSSDVDIFMRFDKKYNDSDLSKFLEKILIDSKIKYKKQKGSRDYFSGKFGPKDYKIEFELVPNRFVTKQSEAVNSTDLSPLHVEFLKFKEKQNPNLCNEIRLAKQFFKAKGLYGAESYIGGFSGHIIDILIMTYGSLELLVEEAKLWREDMFIDINMTYKGSESDAKIALGEDKNSKLVIIDPIITNRNAARALSDENYARFLLVCNRISKLDLDDFKIIKRDYKEVLDLHRSFCKDANLNFVGYQIKFNISGESEDIVGSKLKKLHGKLKKLFLSYDFQIFNDEFFIDIKSGVCLFCFNFEKLILPEYKVLKGPKTFMSSAIKSFLKNRDSYFINEDRICVYDKRRVTDLKQIVKFDKEELEKLLARNIDFVKSVRVLK